MVYNSKKNMTITYIIEFIFSLLLAFSIFKIVYDFKYKTFSILSIFMTIIMICSFFYITFTIRNFLKNNKGEIHKIFVVLMIPIGMLYLFFLIPGHAPDEDAHYYRAYEISTGKLISDATGNKTPFIEVPLDLADTNRQTIKNYDQLVEKTTLKANYNAEIKVDSFTQIYFPVLYTIPALSFFVSRLLDMNIIYALYSARILNFISFLVLGYYSIKLIPFGKILLTTYLFIPMVIHQGISISVDSIVNSTMILFVTFILNLYFKEESISVKDRILFYLFAVFIAFAKTIYVPVIFISIILFFKKKPQTKKEKKIISKLINKDNQYIWIGILLCIIVAVGWFLFVNGFRDSRELIYSNKSDLSQTLFILKSPMEYIQAILNTITIRGNYLINTFIGGKMGWLNIIINEFLVFMYLIILIVSPFFEKHRVELTTKQKVLFITIFCLSTILMFTAMYVNRISPAMDYIENVQGRYFTPIAILLLLCVCNKKKHIEFKYFNTIYPLLIIGLNLMFIYRIICYF